MTIEAKRILDRCDELAKCSETPTAITRVFLSPEMLQAQTLVLAWMRDSGMTARLDAISNCVGRYEGTSPNVPCLMLGSHIDTVRDAGKYDGMLGVITAIECVADLNARGIRLPFALEVVAFADEEGVRFGATLLGSRAVAGTFDLAVLDRTDKAGVSMRDALLAFGLDAAKISEAARKPAEVMAYAELHIEQGPVLENEALAAGVVTAINGANRFMVDVEGLAGHAGTVPMLQRKDALTTAAECILAVEDVARGTADVVGTVGKLETFPGAVNVIPGKVVFSIDVRAPHDDVRMRVVNQIRARLEAIAVQRAVGITITQIYEAGSTDCTAWMQDQLASAISDEGLTVRRLPSGAGHDGMAIRTIAPIGMLFLRCRGGISHNPAESVTLADVLTGAGILSRFIERFHDGRTI